MDQDRKMRRFAFFVLVFSWVLRLSQPGALRDLGNFLWRPETAPVLIYLQTGQDVRSDFYSETTMPQAVREIIPTHPAEKPAVTEAARPEAPRPEAPRPEAQKPDVSSFTIQNGTKKKPDYQALLDAPLTIKPGILLYSTHTTECYTQMGEAFSQTEEYRTLEEEFNMLSIGAALQAALGTRGLPAEQLTTVFDYPKYGSAYAASRKGILKETGGEIPGLLLDLHRDAASVPGGQLRPLAPGEPACAGIMIVVGTDAGGLAHPDWEKNLQLALHLYRALEMCRPGITRGISIRTARFNQDLSEGALLLEIGAAGNSRQEAVEAARVLGEALGSLIKDSTS